METHPAPTLLPPIKWPRLAGAAACLAVAVSSLTWLLTANLGAAPRPAGEAAPSRAEAPNQAPAPREAPPAADRPPRDDEAPPAPDPQGQCEGDGSPERASAPPADWQTTSVDDALTIRHHPDWAVVVDATAPAGFYSPGANEVEVVVAPLPGIAPARDDIQAFMDILDETYGPIIEVTDGGPAALAGGEACWIRASAPAFGTDIEFWVATSGPDALLVAISIPDGASPGDIAAARTMIDTITWNGATA